MKYLVQLDATAPGKWREYNTPSGGAAVFAAVRERLTLDNSPSNWPKIAYRSAGEARHPNGAPVCVIANTLHCAQARTEEAQS